MESENLKPLQCPICNKVYSERTLNTYMAHLKTCGKGKYECVECGKKFFTHHTLINHVRRHTLGAVHTCSLCDRKFDTNFQLVRHSQIHKDKSEREKDRLKCEYCNKTFAWSSSLSRHLQNHFDSETESFFCWCGKGFKNYTSCYSHKKNCTEEKKQVDAEKRTDVLSAESGDHCCQFCNKGFKHRAKLNEHVAHCDPFPFSQITYRSKKEESSSDVQPIDNCDEEQGMNEIETSLEKTSDKQKVISNRAETIEQNSPAKELYKGELNKEAGKKILRKNVNQNPSYDTRNETVDKLKIPNEREASVRRTGRVRKPKQFPDFDIESLEYTKMVRIAQNPIKPLKTDLEASETANNAHATDGIEKQGEIGDKMIFFVDKKVKMNITDNGVEVVILPVEEQERKSKNENSNKRKHDEIDLDSNIKISKAQQTLRQKTKDLLKEKITHSKFKFIKEHSCRVSYADCPVKSETSENRKEMPTSNESNDLDTELKMNDSENFVQETATVCQKEPPKCVKATIKSKTKLPPCNENIIEEQSNGPDSKLETNNSRLCIS